MTGYLYIYIYIYIYISSTTHPKFLKVSYPPMFLKKDYHTRIRNEKDYHPTFHNEVKVDFYFSYFYVIMNKTF